MSQVSLIIKVLKKQLKLHNKTYVDIANHLNISESSIKRLFTQHTFSLQRLEQVCNIMGLELTDFLQLVDNQIQYVENLTMEQEQMLVSDTKLLFICIAVLNHWSFDNIVGYYDITDQECFQKLAILDKIKLIELLPYNKFKILVSHNFSWQPNGPIHKFFHQHMQNDFFNSNFTKENEDFLCLNGMLTHENNLKLQKKIRQLKETFSELHLDSVPKGTKNTSGCALVIALRPWVPDIFEKYKRK